MNNNTHKTTVTIEDIALPKGFAVAKKQGEVIFLPEGVPGDLVEIRIRKHKKQFSYGEIINIEKPSPWRTDPICPHFGRCGGCSLQNIKYDKQTTLKYNHLIYSLRKIGGIDIKDIDILPLIPSPQQFFYRNKMEFSFGQQNREIIIGLREKSSFFTGYTSEVISLDRCDIFSPLVNKIFPVFLNFAKEKSLTCYDRILKRGFLRHLVVREGKNTGEVMLILVTTDELEIEFDELIENISREVPEVKSFYWVINNRQSDVVFFAEKRLLYGSSFIEERLGNLVFRIYPQTFFQPNTKAALLLYEKIRDYLKTKGAEKILGLYCGTGAIEIFLSASVEEVVGIDINPANIATAQENCKSNNITNCLFYEGAVEKTLKKIPANRIDFLIVDPPRSGITPKGIKLILSLNIPFITYVSCNPSTLARDLNTLLKEGYQIKSIIPFDFFPHTTHLETLVFLEKHLLHSL